jgi:hypothetical protein
MVGWRACQKAVKTAVKKVGPKAVEMVGSMVAYWGFQTVGQMVVKMAGLMVD